MSKNKTSSSSQDIPLVPLFHTILAAQNKTSELFVKSFQYQGENIATKHLGQIFGFFEIPDTDEDNAYIVNFLASVVKKEYFVNPKRSATDSFEAALHKINLALTELVKQGNTGWLGKLHGVVAVIENNNFHFSVTGDAAILLYRDSQVTLISEGLTDKDAATHPLKTFLEISSGALIAQDKILITSPELFTLCNTETLRKNAFRMDKNGFARFVRAALVNELPLGVSIIIDIDLAPVVVRPQKKAEALREESREKLQNVFSSTPFISSDTPISDERPSLEAVEEDEELLIEEGELPQSEYTDKKTGHIYVQGETHDDLYHEPSAWQLFLEEQLRPLLNTLGTTLKRFTKKSRKVVTKKAALVGVEGKALSKNLWTLSKTKAALLAAQSSQSLQTKFQTLKNRRAMKEESALVTTALLAEEMESPMPFVVGLPEELSEPDAATKRQAALSRFSPHYERPKKSTSKKSSPSQLPAFLGKLTAAPSGLLTTLQKLSPKQKIIAGSVATVAIAILIFFSLDTPATPAPQESAPSSEASLQSESPVTTEVTPTLGSPTTKASWNEGESLLLVQNDETTVVVTPKSLIVNGQSIPFVADGSIKSAAYMPDLKMIFLWSSANELVSWNIVDRKFTANILPLPAGTQIDMMGAYLTYLYVLDKNAGTIYRFARTEGGFNAPTFWLKTALPKNTAKAFAVNDTIRIAGTTTDQYLQGAKEKTLSEESYQVLGNSSQRTFTLGVQTDSGKLTAWNADGGVTYEGTHEELKGVTAVAYNESNQKLLIAKGQSLIEYSLSW